ncbi:MAG: nucleotidyltransferase domain-containing protein [Nanoarchaeota archaeon]|nr:nucleotidyltransferase domain-containing protein [Nanoarchaeota archaeon]
MNLNEYKVLEIMNKSRKPVFFRELCKKASVSIGGTQQVLKDYSNFIDKKAEGRNTYYSLKENLETLYLKRIIEIKKVQVFIGKNPRFKEFFDYFVKNNIDCLVFGSYAKGMFSKISDIDILALSLKNILEHLCPVRVHAVSLTKSQFESALKKSETLINEISYNHIIINGVDYFTNMLGRK